MEADIAKADSNKAKADKNNIANKAVASNVAIEANEAIEADVNKANKINKADVAKNEADVANLIIVAN